MPDVLRKKTNDKLEEKKREGLSERLRGRVRQEAKNGAPRGSSAPEVIPPQIRAHVKGRRLGLGACPGHVAPSCSTVHPGEEGALYVVDGVQRLTPRYSVRYRCTTPVRQCTVFGLGGAQGFRPWLHAW